MWRWCSEKVLLQPLFQKLRIGELMRYIPISYVAAAATSAVHRIAFVAVKHDCAPSVISYLCTPCSQLNWWLACEGPCWRGSDEMLQVGLSGACHKEPASVQLSSASGPMGVCWRNGEGATVRVCTVDSTECGTIGAIFSACILSTCVERHVPVSGRHQDDETVSHMCAMSTMFCC